MYIMPIPWGPMYVNRAYFGLFGAPGIGMGIDTCSGYRYL